MFHLYGDVTITGEELQILGLCSALKAFEQVGIFIVPHLQWHGGSAFPVSSEGPPHLVAFFDTQGDVENLFYPGSSRVNVEWKRNLSKNNQKFTMKNKLSFSLKGLRHNFWWMLICFNN
jgi:hypothetical protein